MERTFSLYELNQEIKSVIHSSFARTYLVTAEIASINLRHHCYMNLVDKVDEVIRAEMRGVIWASGFGRISSRFRRETGTDLVKGIRILFEASVRFHERYGLSLDILSVDPSYTIGELSAKRREVLERLSREGLRDRNRTLEFPSVPQNIGIISSRTAAGYEDLINHLNNNPYNFRFKCRLYDAVMQGDRAEASIVQAIKRCNDDSSRLDVIVIVRGGGGQTDLHCFDSYEIARAVAYLPVPVISGIGHMRDISVLDEVSNMRAKTPTAVADLLITRAKDFEDSLVHLANRVVHGSGRMLTDMRETLTALARSVQSTTAGEVQLQRQRLDTLARGLTYSFRLLEREMKYIIGSSEKMRPIVTRDMVGQERLLDLFVRRLVKSSTGMLLSQGEILRSRQRHLDHLDPKNILKRGYTITLKNGRVCTSVRELDRDDRISTLLADGEVESIVDAVYPDGSRK